MILGEKNICMHGCNCFLENTSSNQGIIQGELIDE